MADIKDRAREYIAEHSEYSEVFGETFVAVDTLTAMVDFAEQETKDLEKENAELRKVAEFQQSSNMNRHFENKKLKEGLAVGSTFNKALNSMNKTLEEERDKYRNMVFDKDERLTKAKEIIKMFLKYEICTLNIKDELADNIAKAEAFLKDSEGEK